MTSGLRVDRGIVLIQLRGKNSVASGSVVGVWNFGAPATRMRNQAMLSVFSSPSRYTQGKGATSALGQEMSVLGLEGPVLIIAGKTVIGLLAPTWQQTLTEAGLKHAVHRFSGECSLTEIERVKTREP